MVTLNHQNFWQPTTGILRECSDNSPQYDSSEVSGQSITHVERCEVNGYLLWKSGSNDRNEMGNFGTYDYFSIRFHLGRPNKITLESQNGQSTPETILEASARDTSAGATCSDHPDYPEEVALHPSSRGSSSPSVTGLDGPGTSRVFDVFRDDPAEQQREYVHLHPSVRGKKRTLEEPYSPRKRPQTGYLNTADSEIATTRRRSPEDESPLQDEESHSYKQASIMDSIRYLKQFYNLASAEAQFSGDLVDGDIYKESLVVVQNAIKFLQHSYGIIATSNLLMNETENNLSTTWRRSYSATSKKWEAEDDHLLSELRDDQKLEWNSIFRYFPKRSPSAIKQRHSIIRSRMSDSPSSKENHPRSSLRPVKSSSAIRKSHRLSRRSELGARSSRIERQPRYLTRTRKGSPNTPN